MVKEFFHHWHVYLWLILACLVVALVSIGVDLLFYKIGRWWFGKPSKPRILGFKLTPKPRGLMFVSSKKEDDPKTPPDPPQDQNNTDGSGR
jgi:hypothetical protein